MSTKRLRTRITAIAGVIAVLLVGGIWVALQGSAQPAAGQTAGGSLKLTSASPAETATGVNGTTPIEVHFSAPVAADSAMPTVKPGIAGSWHGAGTSTLEFRPAAGFKQDTNVTVTIPAGTSGVRSASGGQLARAQQVSFRTGSYQTARLDQVLAQLGYLPLTWQATGSSAQPTSAAAQLSAAYAPPQGKFTWDAGYPTTIRKFWHGGATSGLILSGAVMAFESNHGLARDGVAGQRVWAALLKAEADNQKNAHGYTYAVASEASPETLTIWHNGRVVLHSLTNTGIPQSPTTIGTSPVYLRYNSQVMRGTNPNGSKYAEQVYYVSYFRGSLAVHYDLRPSYGFPQSLGCVELPMNEAKQAFPYLTYGSLVTVQPGALTPSTSPTDPTT
ncbi:MAG TPA: Ig-like domain-containing protein [Streptosporangiaceae bacterium]|nr:Ig-like domain-containing protein [Streptosporangiaceae bacterium]